jgi:hypothetical protein
MSARPAQGAITRLGRARVLADTAAPNAVHRLDPARRAVVLAELSAAERRLLGAVCCSHTSLAEGARRLGLSTEESLDLLERAAAKIDAEPARQGPSPPRG